MNNAKLKDLYKIRFSNNYLPRKNAIWKVLCRDFLQNFIPKTNTVIDVASGYGEFINNIKAQRKIAIDLNPEAPQYLNQDVKFQFCSALEIENHYPSTADTIFTSNFLEHLSDKSMLNKFFDQVLISLKPGGYYIIFGPNARYEPGRYRDYYNHHLGLTDKSLYEASILKDFDIDRCIAKFLPFTTQESIPTHPFFVWLYLRILCVQIFSSQFFFSAHKKHYLSSNT